MKYQKPSLSIDEQIALLEARGLHVPNHDRARHYLSNISYYRLRAYMMPYQQPGNDKHPFTLGTTFDQVLDLYIFDRELRILVFDAIERIEIALRAQIIHQFAITYGPHWYENPALYRDLYDYGKNMTKLDEEMERSNEVFIKHYLRKYTQPKRPPSWMSLEVTTMGLLSKIFKSLKDIPEKKAIARHFNVGHPKILESWMHSLSYVRNICAHHSRLWNRTLTIKPKLPNNTPQPWLHADTRIAGNTLYALLCCSYYLLKAINPDSSFKESLSALIARNPAIDIRKMGFTPAWKQEPLWL